MIDELIKSQKEAKDSGESDLDFFSDTHMAQTIGNILVGGRYKYTGLSFRSSRGTVLLRFF